MNMRNIIAKYLIFPIENRSLHFWNNLRMLEKSQWLSHEDISHIQWNKLNNLIKHSYISIPFYRKLFDKENISVSEIRSLDDLKKLPCLSKQIIRDNIDEMISREIDKKTLIKTTTSGSTGRPVSVFRDIHADRIHTAAGWRYRRWCNHGLGDHCARIVVFPTENESSRQLSIKSRIKKAIDDAFKTEERLNALDAMSDSLLEGFFQTIKKKKIQLLVGYATLVYYFSLYVNKHHPGEITFKSVRTISEMLHEHQRKFIEDAFGCRVFDTYGNRENGLIAAECSKHNGYHINAENIYIEIVDQNGNPVFPGESGEIAITDLNNYAMPLIRYLSGDKGRLSTKLCSCGRGLPLIDRIEGRMVDSLMLLDGSVIGGVTVSHFFTKCGEVEQFQFIQNHKGEADLLLKIPKPFSSEQLEQFKQKLNSYFNNRILINLHFVDVIPLSESCKHKYIISNILD